MSLLTLTISSVVASFALYYAHRRSLYFLDHLQFYALLWCVWLAHIAGSLFYSIILWPKYFSPLRHLPEPAEGRSWWNGFGSRAFFGAKGEPVAQWNRSLRHNGIFRYLDVLNTERVAITSPELVAEVLQRTQDFEQSRTLFLLAAPILGPGIILVNGEEHKRQRKILSPCLSTKEIRLLQPLSWEKSVELLQKITELVANTASASGFSEPISVDHHAGHVTLDSISKAALGMDFEPLKKPDSELVHNYRGVFEPTTVFRLLAVAKIVFPSWLVESLPHPRVREAKRAIALLHNVCRTSAQQKKALMAKNQLTSPDIISSLIRDRGVTDEDELITNSMPLLNAFVSESLRYWPPVGQIGRQTARDTMLKDVMIPKGITLHLSIRSFNHDPVNWGPDAREFKPERWLRRDEATGELAYVPNGGALTKQALMTFIHGGRDCIGRVFARSEILHVLAGLVGRFEFVLTDLSYMDETKIQVSGGGCVQAHSQHQCTRTTRTGVVRATWLHAERTALSA
ncbi:hypothetical protein VTI74DRAFT_11221 [Chaetomium olivicolor]